jgi:steroid delta-isomerase-like uncharacterized protein
MSEQNKNLERRLFDQVYNRGDFTVVDELIARDYLGHSPTPGTENRGRESFKQFYATLRQAFPDLRFTIEDLIAEGDKVVVRWTARGTFAGEFQGIPPNGNHGAITGITIDRIAGGKVVECWTNADDLGMMQLLGFVPELAQAGG